MSARDLLRLASRDVWSATRTNGGHIRLDHPEATMPVFTAATPSCPRTLQNTMAQMKRVLPPEPKEPVVERPRRRPKPKPAKRQIDRAIDWQRPPEPELPIGVGGAAPRRRPIPGGPSGYFTTRWP